MTDDVFVVETSLAQRSLWFVHEMDPGLPVYNVTAVVRIRGPLVPAVLEQALNAVVARHEILRTSFERDASEPVQVIHPELHVTIPVTELAEADVPRAVEEEVRRPFDLARVPLLRMSLLRLTHDEHIAVLVMHHMVTDGWSSAILFSELSECYEAIAEDREARLQPLPIQYADYAVWENDTLRGDLLDGLIGYWSGQLAGAVPVQLPTDRLPGPELSFRGDIVTFPIAEKMMAEVSRLAKDLSATPFMILLAAWQALLARESGQYDVAVACPVANRERPEIAGLIGYFVNTVIMRTDLMGDPAFLDVLERVRAVSTGALGHQQLPFGMLVEKLEPQRHSGPGVPFARAMFSLQNTASGPWKSASLTLEPGWLATGTAKFEVSLGIEPTASGYAGALVYSTELYDRATIEGLAGRFLTLLRGALDDPACALSRLPLLTADQRAALIRIGRAIRPAAPGTFVHRLVAQRAHVTPDMPALTFRGQPTTYLELASRAGKLAHNLAQLGPPPETPVAVLLDDPVELTAACLGVMAAGCAAVPADPAADPPGYAVHAVTASGLHRLAPDGSLRAVADLATSASATLPDGVLTGNRLALIDPASGRMFTHAGLAARADWPLALAEVMAALAGGTVIELGETALGNGTGRDAGHGRPPAAEVHVLDERLEQVPVGVPGEVYFGGPAISSGYWQDPARTAQRFVADPYTPGSGGRLYRTGQMGKLRADGELEVLGAAGRRVVIQGMPVQHEWIESVLGAHPDVADCATRVRAGAEHQELGAYVVAAAGHDLDVDGLRVYLAGRLPRSMVPVGYKLVTHIRRTPAGMPDWAALPEFDQPSARAAAPPRTPIEQSIASMVAGLVGLDQVDMNANFFELGGHSLLAVQLVDMAFEKFGVELPLRLLIDASLHDLTRFVLSELIKADAAAGTG